MKGKAREHKEKGPPQRVNAAIALFDLLEIN